ncbi:hypothetical protein BCF11_0468 [Collimonas sp. PA-H2]|nr:hypothetical protein BCF11_0468 [Collimonas sp. PA-H2]
MRGRMLEDIDIRLSFNGSIDAAITMNESKRESGLLFCGGGEKYSDVSSVENTDRVAAWQ